jgi:hypothetical protein
MTDTTNLPPCPRGLLQEVWRTFCEAFGNDPHLIAPSLVYMDVNEYVAAGVPVDVARAVDTNLAVKARRFAHALNMSGCPDDILAPSGIIMMRARRPINALRSISVDP